MSSNWRALTLFIFIFLNCLFLGCDPNAHKPSDHPCNFPDLDTERDLLAPWTYKIIDKNTSLNLVDTTKNAIIHADSVLLMDENLQPMLPTGLGYRYRYSIDNWVFYDFLPYNGMEVPFKDPQAYLDLEQRTFYLKTSKSDLDTIQIVFQQCLVFQVFFNGVSTGKPSNDPLSGSASFYFKK